MTHHEAQRGVFALNNRINARRATVLATLAGRIDPDVELDDAELNALLQQRRGLFDSMPKASSAV